MPKQKKVSPEIILAQKEILTPKTSESELYAQYDSIMIRIKLRKEALEAIKTGTHINFAVENALSECNAVDELNALKFAGTAMIISALEKQLQADRALMMSIGNQIASIS